MNSKVYLYWSVMHKLSSELEQRLHVCYHGSSCSAGLLLVSLRPGAALLLRLLRSLFSESEPERGHGGHAQHHAPDQPQRLRVSRSPQSCAAQTQPHGEQNTPSFQQLVDKNKQQHFRSMKQQGKRLGPNTQPCGTPISIPMFKLSHRLMSTTGTQRLRAGSWAPSSTDTF